MSFVMVALKSRAKPQKFFIFFNNWGPFHIWESMGEVFSGIVFVISYLMMISSLIHYVSDYAQFLVGPSAVLFILGVCVSLEQAWAITLSYRFSDVFYKNVMFELS